MNNLSLLRSPRFGPFFATQFLGAFNDNFFKNALIVLVVFHSSDWTTLTPGTLSLLASAIFMLPFFLCSAIAGQLADKYPRDSIARTVKQLEIGIMILSSVGFALKSMPILLLCLFLFGVHSAFFGPVKYAILPQHLSTQELLAGNALIEGGTFIAILGGTILGALVASLPFPDIYIPLCGLALAGMGWFTSLFIPTAQGPQPNLNINYNPATSTWKTIQQSQQQKDVFPSIIAISSFWALGLVYLSQFPIISKDLYQGNEVTVSLLLGLFSIGIGIGSIICEKISHHEVNMHIVDYAGYLLSIFTFLFGVILSLHLNIMWVSSCTLILGILGGFYCVPLYTAMQQRSDEKTRAQTIASNNIMNSFFMVIAAALQAVLLPYIGIPGIFILSGIFFAGFNYCASYKK